MQVSEREFPNSYGKVRPPTNLSSQSGSCWYAFSHTCNSLSGRLSANSMRPTNKITFSFWDDGDDTSLLPLCNTLIFSFNVLSKENVPIMFFDIPRRAQCKHQLREDEWGSGEIVFSCRPEKRVFPEIVKHPAQHTARTCQSQRLQFCWFLTNTFPERNAV